MNPPIVRTISECFIKPQYPVEEIKPPIHLAPWDLTMLSVHYIQKGLLFIKPQTSTNDQENPVKYLLDRLKESLSLTLVHFYPLAGRLATLKQENPPSYSVYIDCNNSPGAKFIYATADLTISDILSPVDVLVVFQYFFDHHKAINHDGHSMSLLSIQVTELIDEIFIGCSANHAVPKNKSKPVSVRSDQGTSGPDQASKELYNSVGPTRPDQESDGPDRECKEHAFEVLSAGPNKRCCGLTFGSSFALLHILDAFKSLQSTFSGSLSIRGLKYQ